MTATWSWSCMDSHRLTLDQSHHQPQSIGEIVSIQCMFCLFILIASGASHGIVVTPPTSLAGVDCEAQKSDLAFGLPVASGCSAFIPRLQANHLWVSAMTAANELNCVMSSHLINDIQWFLSK